MHKNSKIQIFRSFTSRNIICTTGTFELSLFNLSNINVIEKLSFEKRQLLRHRNDLQSASVFKFVSLPADCPSWLITATLFVVCFVKQTDRRLTKPI